MTTVAQNILNQSYNTIMHDDDVLPSAGRSFIAGFVCNVITSGGNPFAALIGGAVSSTASLIDAAVRPSLTTFFGEDFQDSMTESFARNIVVMTFTSLASAAITPFFGLTVALSTLSSMFIRAVYSAFEGESMGRTQLIPVRVW